MQYTSFLKYIKESFEGMKGENTTVRIQSVLKNNNVHYDALTIMPKGCNYSPTIYLNDYYKEYEAGTSLASIVHEIDSFYETARVGFNVNDHLITDFDQAKERIAFKLINFEENMELLADVPYMRVLDLAQVFFILLDSEKHGEATALITNDHINMWGITPAQLLAQAMKNAPVLLKAQYQSMESMMVELIVADLKKKANECRLEQDLPEDAMLTDDTFEKMAREALREAGTNANPNMYVLTNEKKCQGASTILYPGLLEKISETLGDFYVLPSSIHEVILLKDESYIHTEELYSMVKEINETEVSPVERLSDTVYYYDSEAKNLIIARITENAKQSIL